MATVQVLPPSSGSSSRKKEHLEAGKRRLEEFRKKKAADRAKKATSSIQPNPAEAVVHEKQPSQADDVPLTDSDGAGTSDRAALASSEPSSEVIDNEIKANEFLHKTDLDSSYETHSGGGPFSVNNYYAYSADKVQTHANDLGFRAYDNVNSQEAGNNDKFGINFGTLGGLAVKTATVQASAFQHSSNHINTGSSQYSYYGSPESLSNNTDSPSKDLTAVKSGASHQIASNGDSVHRASETTNFSSEVQKNMDRVFNYNNPLVPENGERVVSSFVGHLTSASSPSPWSTESRSSGFDFDTRSSSRRTRPSFLDSIHASTVSLASAPLTEPETGDSLSSKVQSMDILYSSALQNGTNSQVAAGNGDGINEHNMERNHNFQSPKVDEDFAALEQHIEDLTQEKFSLQRALEASRTLAESLAAENSALTDSYNQQGSAVQQLKLDMEKLQEEIKGQMVELESVKIAYTNAQMECSAADERAKLLASEVIELEEKALRLRSSELKLERQLENLQAEVSSSKKKISSLEKERKDLQLTIDAMQEEKKMLQSMLRKASASGKSIDISKSSNNKKDASTSTQDLVLDSTDRDDRNPASDSSNLEMCSTSLRNENDDSSYLLQPENADFSLEAPLNIPPDQLRTIQNINTLISELALEKEELMQALSTESSQSSKLKELNKELTRKLEVQTQRLELLTAQNMVNDNIPPPRQPDSRPVHDNIAYADEGDEVVERVLGWIMKLFPGGPSKRRTSKLI